MASNVPQGLELALGWGARLGGMTRRGLVGLLVVLSSSMLSPAVGGALVRGGCMMASVTAVQDQPIAPGSPFVVRGEFFGDDCHDTGIPAGALGALGTPRSDIEVLLVQGDRTWTVARGHADRDYGFVVEATTPADVEAGTALLGYRLDDGSAMTTSAVQVDPPPRTSRDDRSLATFGQRIGPSTENDVFLQLAPWLVLAGAAAVIGIVVGRGRLAAPRDGRHREPPASSTMWDRASGDVSGTTGQATVVDFHPTPEAAALATWSSCPTARAHVISVEVRGDEAHVVIDTDPTYPDYVRCRRDDAGWTAVASGNGPMGWLHD